MAVCPSRGSVCAWVATAPICALTYGHRDATAIACVAMPTPNLPVRWHRAITLKVLKRGPNSVGRTGASFPTVVRLSTLFSDSGLERLRVRFAPDVRAGFEHAIRKPAHHTHRRFARHLGPD